MKAKLLTRSVYLSIVLVVTIAAGGCVLIPTPGHEGIAPDEIRADGNYATTGPTL